MSRPRRLRVFWPLTLICLGAGLLLAETGWLGSAGLWRLAATWPVFVILGGLALIFRCYLQPVPAALALVAAFAVLCGGATVYAFTGPVLGTTATVSGSQSRGSADAASLVINAASATVRINAGDTGDDLYRATVTGASQDRPAIRFDAASGRVTIDVHSTVWWPALPARSGDVDVTLNRDVRWDVTVNAAAVDGTMDLATVAGEVQVNAASSRMAITMAAPVRRTAVQLNGAAVQAEIHLPQGAPCRVVASGAAASVTVDGVRHAGVGDESWKDPAYDSAGARCEVAAAGASATVSVVHH